MYPYPSTTLIPWSHPLSANPIRASGSWAVYPGVPVQGLPIAKLQGLRLLGNIGKEAREGKQRRRLCYSVETCKGPGSEHSVDPNRSFSIYLGNREPPFRAILHSVVHPQ